MLRLRRLLLRHKAFGGTGGVGVCLAPHAAPWTFTVLLGSGARNRSWSKVLAPTISARTPKALLPRRGRFAMLLLQSLLGGSLINGHLALGILFASHACVG